MRPPGDPTPTRLLSAVLVLVGLFGACHVAQAVPNFWMGPNLGDYNTDANWSIGLVPNSCCDEVATINNNTTAALATTAPNANGLLLGQAAADIGGLRISNGGSLTTVAFTGGANGALTIGGSGQGNLTILGGGSLSGPTLSLGGLVGSSILLGDTSGLTASLTTTGAATLNRTTQVTGRFVNFNAGGNLTLGSTSTLIGQINHGTLHSPLKSAGAANLNGTFKAEFSGVTPTAGNSWDIIDAMAINGNFATLDTSAAPALPAGQIYRLRRTTGGTNGQLLQLSVQQVLALQVNRSTGAVSIANIGASPVTLDGYSILSSFGALTGSWNSLQDQSVAGWVETPSSVNDLNELHPTMGGLTLNGAQSRALGAPYVPVFPEFGVDPDHLEFEYSTSDGDTLTGVVQYTGTKVHNDFVLNVNPATGAVAFRNDSPFEIAIDGYAIYSASGSLTPATWNSLDDQNVSDWEQAPPAPTANVVSELKADGVTTFQGQTGFSLGQLFKTVGATQDLRFEFLMEGDDIPSVGTVVYGPFTPPMPPTEGLDGDFNNDGSVDAADYVVWRKNDGTTAGYNLWRTNFGRTAGSGSDAPSSLASVPEPGALCLLMVAGLAVVGVSRRRFPARRMSLVAAAIAALFVGAGAATAQELFYEDFEDTTLAPGAATNFATISGGIASFTDTSATSRARFVDIQTFTTEVMTFSFDAAAPVTTSAGQDNELVLRAGIGTANNTLSSTEFIIEAIAFRTTMGGTVGGPRGDFLNNGNESIFVVANNKDTPLVFTSPIDGSDVTLNGFQYINYVRDNNSGDFGLLIAAPGIANMADRNGVDPGPGTITRFGVGSSSNTNQGTFALDNVRVVTGVSFGAVAPMCIPGDTNCDDVVDLENDFEAIRMNFRDTGASRSEGDLTGDGLVSLPDFVQWKTAFLSGGGSTDGVNFRFLNVPEPSTCVPAVVAMLGLVGCRWNRCGC